MPIYLDHNATTPLDPRVLEAMQPFFTGPYGNASSVHRYGRMARDAIETARAQVAALVGAEPAQVLWTSGATESNNLAVKGIAALRAGRLLYGATEHPAVLEAMQALGREGRTVETIAIGRDGLVDPVALAAQLDGPSIALVALMQANNETGVIQDVGALAELIHAAGSVLLVDAVQAAGKIPVDFDALGADLMSLSAHKLYGPKGVGALVRRADVELRPQLHGGGQEKGLRGGTENLAGIVGFGMAAELAREALQARRQHVLSLRDELIAGLHRVPGAIVFGEAAPRLPNTVQFGVEGWEGEALLMALDRKGIAVSSGSACASGTGEPSHVLLAMGWPREIAYRAVRVSFGMDSPEDAPVRLLAELRSLTGAG